jgi:hypothetical protein
LFVVTPPPPGKIRAKRAGREAGPQEYRNK